MLQLVAVGDFRTRALALRLALPRYVAGLFVTRGDIAWVVAPLTFGVLVLRRPEAIVRPQFYWEEADAFRAWVFAGEGADLLLRPWAGYLTLIPRTAHVAASWLPPQIAPVITTAILYSIVAFAAAFIASERLAVALPSRTVRLLISGLVVLLPGAGPMLLSSLNVQWFMAIIVAAIALATEATSRRQRWLEVVAVAVASLTGPLAPVYVALFGLRRLTRHRIVLMGSALVGSIVQLIVFAASARPLAKGYDAVSTITVLLERSATSLLGTRLGLFADELPTSISVILGGFILASAMLCLRALPRQTWMTLTILGATTAILGTIATGPRELAASPTHERYFVLGAFAIGAIGIAGLAGGRRWALPIVLLLGAGVIGDVRIDSLQDTSWAANSSCIGSNRRCFVPIYPAPWSVSWPGNPDAYVPADGVDVKGYPVRGRGS